MSESIFERITAFLSRKSAVQRVADDPALASELLLLLHVVFADGDQHPAEIAAFKEIAEKNFGIPPEELPEVAEYISRILLTRRQPSKPPTCWRRWRRSVGWHCWVTL